MLCNTKKRHSWQQHGPLRKINQIQQIQTIVHMVLISNCSRFMWQLMKDNNLVKLLVPIV